MRGKQVFTLPCFAYCSQSLWFEGFVFKSDERQTISFAKNTLFTILFFSQGILMICKKICITVLTLKSCFLDLSSLR
jgi:hypothetical protein